MSLEWLWRLAFRLSFSHCFFGLDTNYMENAQASLASMDIDALATRSNLPVLVKCYAPACTPCGALGLLLDQMDVEMADKVTVEKVDVSASPDVARKYDVRSVPTLLLFKQGTLVATRTGAASRTQLLTWLSAQGVF